MVRRGQVAGGYAWWMTDNGPGVVRVRAARPDEVEALLGIQQAASGGGLSAHLPARLVPVSGCGGAGAVEVAPERLDGLFVLPCAWGSGVADRLHDAAVRRLRGWGCGWCRLSVLEENQRARRFYE